MKKKPAFKAGRFHFLLSLALLSQIFLFSQCKKEREEPLPDHPSVASPDSSNQRYQSIGRVAYVIKATEQVIDGENLDLKPGDIIKIATGNRGPLLLKNIKGSSSSPITIINENGKTTIESSGAYGLKTENCQYFRLSGSGSTSINKGLVIDGGQIGVSFDKFSSDFEVDNIEVKNCGFAGIMAKTDPSCELQSAYGGFIMQNLKFHDNFVHDVKGEGFYVGNSFFFEGRDLDCGKIRPHEIHNVDIYNNKVMNSGCEGIQAGCVTQGLRIHHNTVENFGISPFAQAQDNGVQIGEGSSGDLYNNVIQNGPGNGIIVLGQGNTKIYNNLVVNPGTHGAFVDNRGSAYGDISFIHNTFINVKDGGIKTYNELVSHKFHNNIIVGNNASFSYDHGASGDEKNNLIVSSVAECGFINADGGDYRLSSGSPAIDKGIITEITADLGNKSRSSGAAPDIGAYEF